MAAMTRRTLGYALWALSAILAVAWLVEAFTKGRGFVSTYLAPFAILGNLAGMFLMWSAGGSSPRWGK